MTSIKVITDKYDFQLSQLEKKLQESEEQRTDLEKQLTLSTYNHDTLLSYIKNLKQINAE